MHCLFVYNSAASTDGLADVLAKTYAFTWRSKVQLLLRNYYMFLDNTCSVTSCYLQWLETMFKALLTNTYALFVVLGYNYVCNVHGTTYKYVCCVPGLMYKYVCYVQSILYTYVCYVQGITSDYVCYVQGMTYNYVCYVQGIPWQIRMLCSRHYIQIRRVMPWT